MAWKSTLELGELIVSTPELLKEVERLVDVLLMPRGARVKLRKALARVREHQAIDSGRKDGRMTVGGIDHSGRVDVYPPDSVEMQGLQGGDAGVELGRADITPDPGAEVSGGDRD